MAYTSAQITVTKTPTLIYAAQPGDLSVWVRSTNVYLGGDNSISDTTSAFPPGDYIELQLNPGDEIWGKVRNADGATSYVVPILVRSR